VHYIEKLPSIALNEKNTDMKQIYEPYRIFKFGVKPSARKMRVSASEKGESTC
jgi:hypothetical protein